MKIRTLLDQLCISRVAAYPLAGDKRAVLLLGEGVCLPKSQLPCDPIRNSLPNWPIELTGSRDLGGCQVLILELSQKGFVNPVAVVPRVAPPPSLPGRRIRSRPRSTGKPCKCHRHSEPGSTDGRCHVDHVMCRCAAFIFLCHKLTERRGRFGPRPLPLGPTRPVIGVGVWRAYKGNDGQQRVEGPASRRQSIPKGPWQMPASGQFGRRCDDRPMAT